MARYCHQPALASAEIARRRRAGVAVRRGSYVPGSRGINALMKFGWP